MHTTRPLSLSIGLGLSLLVGSVGATAGTDAQAATLFWLAGLPTWVLPAVLAVVFSGLSWIGLAILRRARPATAGGRRARWVAAAGGALLGVVVALLGAGPWQNWLLGEIDALPPTAAVPPSHRVADLLDLPDPGDAASGPSKPKKLKGDRARHAKVNFDALQATSINLNLFGDTVLTAVRDRIVEGMKGGLVWVGHIDGYEDSAVTLAAKGKALMGTVAVDGRYFEIVYVRGSTHAVRELDPNKIPAEFEPQEEPTPPPDLADAQGDVAGATAPAATEAGGTGTGTVIDLMVLYTPAARNNAGGVAGIEAKILNAVTRANQAYLNSQIAMQLNLVYVGEVAYTETGNMITALSRLMGTTDGYMDQVHALRNQYGADQVALVEADSNYCGYSSIMSTVSTDFANRAFAVVHDDSVYDCIGSNDTLAHELGHGQGNVHNIENAPTQGAYPDSYGYRVCGTFRDIMGYPCDYEPRIPYFSNPNITYQGLPTGIPGASDTARSMNANAATVAAFRATVVLPPAAPTNLTAAATTTDSVTLAWADNGASESGYKVQGSVDGTTWAEIAALDQNAVGFVDAGLSPGTYYYRVYAYNGSGTSGYSNTATATLSAPRVMDTTPPVVKITNPLPGTKVTGTVSIKVTATDDVALSGLKLYIDNKLVSATNTGAITYAWDTKKATAGAHSIRADAIDTSGNTGTLSVAVKK